MKIYEVQNFNINSYLWQRLANLFGGWDMALQTLVIFMAADWITGTAMVHFGSGLEQAVTKDFQKKEDIIGLIDPDGKEVVKYTYNSWGKVIRWSYIRSRLG